MVDVVEYEVDVGGCICFGVVGLILCGVLY